MEGIRTLAVAGWRGAGKSAFAQAFAHYLRKRGTDAEVANWDAGAKRISYPASFDIRGYFSWTTLLRECGGDARAAHARVFEEASASPILLDDWRAACTPFTLMDLGGGLDALVSPPVASFLGEHADALLWLEERGQSMGSEDAVRQQGISALLYRLMPEVRCAIALTKCDGRAAVERPRKLIEFTVQTPLAGDEGMAKPFPVSSVSRRGFSEIEGWLGLQGHDAGEGTPASIMI